jgi:hypothetical protein
MATLISTAEAVAHLRIDLDEDDSPANPYAADLAMKMDQAESIILDYLKVTGDSPAYNPTGDDLHCVKSAILIVLWNLFEDRGGTGKGDYLAENGPVARLLRRLRDPALA